MDDFKAGQFTFNAFTIAGIETAIDGASVEIAEAATFNRTICGIETAICLSVGTGDEQVFLNRTIVELKHGLRTRKLGRRLTVF